MDYNTYFKKSDNRLKLLYKIKKEELWHTNTV